HAQHRALPSFPTRRSSDLCLLTAQRARTHASDPASKLAGDLKDLASKGHVTADQIPHRRGTLRQPPVGAAHYPVELFGKPARPRSEEHTSELQSRSDIVCR